MGAFKHADTIKQLNKDAFNILWNDMIWRSELSKLRRPAMLQSLGREALMMAGWKYSSEVHYVDFFNMYAKAMLLVDQKLEECESGRYADDLYFYNLPEFESDLKELKRFLRENDIDLESL